MSTKSQVSITNGLRTVRVYANHDGYPENVLPMLRQAAKAGNVEPLEIAYSVLEKYPEWDLRIVAQDSTPESLDFHYNVDVSKQTWLVTTTEQGNEVYKNRINAKKPKLNNELGSATTAGALASLLSGLRPETPLYLNDWNAGVAVQAHVTVTPTNTTARRENLPPSLTQNDNGEINSALLSFWNEGRLELKEAA